MIYRAGLVGCGGVSWDHCKGLMAAKNVELVALADVQDNRLTELAQGFGIERRYSNYREMIANEKLDILSICTQAPQHAPVVIDAANAGVKGILCEKPIAMTLREADAMIEACSKRGARLAINHQTRMIPAVWGAQKLVREGAIGELRAAHLLDKGGRPAGNSLMELVTHLFDLLRVYAGTPAWVSGHLTVTAENGSQRIAGPRDIQPSQTAWPGDRDCGLVLGERCTAVFGFPEREDYHKGMIATLDSFFQPVRTAAGVAWHPSLTLLGTEGVLFLGGTSDHVDAYLHQGPWAPPGNMKKLEVAPPEIAAGPYAELGAQAPCHTAMIDELTAAIEQGREHRSSGTDGRWALEMIMGIYESHRREGARTPLPLPYRDHPLQEWLNHAP